MAGREPVELLLAVLIDLRLAERVEHDAFDGQVQAHADRVRRHQYLQSAYIRVTCMKHSEGARAHFARVGGVVELGGLCEFGAGRERAVDDGRLVSAALELARHAEDVGLVEADDAVAGPHVLPAAQAALGHRQLGEALVVVQLQCTVDK